MARLGERKSAMLLNVVCLFAFMRIASGINDIAHGGSYCHLAEKDSATKYGVDFSFKMDNCNEVKCTAAQIGAGNWNEIFSPEDNSALQKQQCKCSLTDGKTVVFSKKTATCDANFCWKEYSSMMWQMMHIVKTTREATAVDNDIQSVNHWVASCASDPITKMPPVAVLAIDEKLTEKQQKEIKKLLEKGGVPVEEASAVPRDVSGTYTNSQSPPSTRIMFVTQTTDGKINIIFAKGDGSPDEEDIQGGSVVGNEVIGIAGGTITISGSDPDLQLEFVGGNNVGVWVRQAANDCKDVAMVWKGYESKTYFIQEGLVRLEQTLTELASTKTTLDKDLSDLQANYKKIDGAGRLCSFTEIEDHFTWNVALVAPLTKPCNTITCTSHGFQAAIKELINVETVAKMCDCSYLGTYWLNYKPQGVECSIDDCLNTYITQKKTEYGNEVPTGQSLTDPDHWVATCDKNGVMSDTLPVSEAAQSKAGVSTKMTPTTADHGDSQDKDVAVVDEGLASAAVKAAKEDCSPVVEKLKTAKKKLDDELDKRTEDVNKLGNLHNEIEELKKQNVKWAATLKVMGVKQ